jgi:hypothetical protein
LTPDSLPFIGADQVSWSDFGGFLDF